MLKKLLNIKEIKIFWLIMQYMMGYAVLKLMSVNEKVINVARNTKFIFMLKN